MRPFAGILLSLAISTGVLAQTNPTTVNNDDSCDIGLYPAATLLLPYFEVDVTPAMSRTTIFSITNVSALPQIARVTLWTDWAYPVLTFNIFLTGYDVQPINLYDVIARGMIASPSGTSTSSPNARTFDGIFLNPNFGTTPLTNLANPNFLPQAGSDCAPGRLPGMIPAPLLNDVRSIFTTGMTSGTTVYCTPGVEQRLGWNHGANTAIGYMTVDVVATCSAAGPFDSRYFNGEILFDNVLTGDYQQVDADPERGNYAGGNPMVHIRAVPEGGGAGSLPTTLTSLPFTFYDRYTIGAADRRIDRRQPLPSTFAARVISGTVNRFETHLLVWREGMTSSHAACADYAPNGNLPIAELVRYDERENANVLGSQIITIPLPPSGLPATSRLAVTSIVYPSITSTDAGGWLYMNLANGGSSQGAVYSAARNGFGSSVGSRDISQNWVTVMMFAEGRYGVTADATSLGNGCSPFFPPTANATNPASPLNHIGPAGGVVVCPKGTLPTNGDSTACRGSNLNP